MKNINKVIDKSTKRQTETRVRNEKILKKIYYDEYKILHPTEKDARRDNAGIRQEMLPVWRDGPLNRTVHTAGALEARNLQRRKRR